MLTGATTFRISERSRTRWRQSSHGSRIGRDCRRIRHRRCAAACCAGACRRTSLTGLRDIGDALLELEEALTWKSRRTARPPRPPPGGTSAFCAARRGLALSIGAALSGAAIASARRCGRCDRRGTRAPSAARAVQPWRCRISEQVGGTRLFRRSPSRLSIRTSFMSAAEAAVRSCSCGAMDSLGGPATGRHGGRTRVHFSRPMVSGLRSSLRAP